MKNLKDILSEASNYYSMNDILKESLRIGINDKPEDIDISWDDVNEFYYVEFYNDTSNQNLITIDIIKPNNTGIVTMDEKGKQKWQFSYYIHNCHSIFISAGINYSIGEAQACNDGYILYRYCYGQGYNALKLCIHPSMKDDVDKLIDFIYTNDAPYKFNELVRYINLDDTIKELDNFDNLEYSFKGKVVFDLLKDVKKYNF